MIRFKATPEEKPVAKAAVKPAKSTGKAKPTKDAAAPKEDLLDLSADDTGDKN